MGTDTKVRPDRTEVRTERTVTAPPSESRVRTFLMVVAFVAVLGMALVVAALVSGEPVSTDQPQPSVSPVQAERWGEAAEETASQELQRFDTYRDVAPYAAARVTYRQTAAYAQTHGLTGTSPAGMTAAVVVWPDHLADTSDEAVDHEVQRFRNAVDVDRPTEAEQQEQARFENAVNVER